KLCAWDRTAKFPREHRPISDGVKAPPPVGACSLLCVLQLSDQCRGHHAICSDTPIHDRRGDREGHVADYLERFKGRTRTQEVFHFDLNAGPIAYSGGES